MAVIPGRAAVAADRVLQAHAAGAPIEDISIRIVAWVLGAEGRALRDLGASPHALQANLTHLLGAGELAAAEAYILEHHARSPGGSDLLFTASTFAPMAADTWIEVAHRLGDDLPVRDPFIAGGTLHGEGGATFFEMITA